MKITDVEIRFPENARPITIVTFDKPVLHATPRYVAAYEKQYEVRILRGDDGDFIMCGVESKPKGKEFPKLRLPMHDGTHMLAFPLLPANEVSVNAALRMCDPVMGVIINDPEQGAIQGHCDVVALARILYARYSAGADREGPAMACVEWPSGVRVYEPVMATWSDELGHWTAKPGREGDKIVFLCTPDDKLSPLLEALDKLKQAGQDGRQQ